MEQIVIAAGGITILVLIFGGLILWYLDGCTHAYEEVKHVRIVRSDDEAVVGDRYIYKCTKCCKMKQYVFTCNGQDSMYKLNFYYPNSFQVVKTKIYDYKPDGQKLRILLVVEEVLNEREMKCKLFEVKE